MEVLYSGISLVADVGIIVNKLHINPQLLCQSVCGAPLRDHGFGLGSSHLGHS